MAVWKLLLITFLSAIVIGLLAGVIIGKYLVWREHSAKKQLFTKKQSLLLWACAGIGILSIVLGLCYPIFFKPDEEIMDQPPMIDGMMDGMENPASDTTGAPADAPGEIEDGQDPGLAEAGQDNMPVTDDQEPAEQEADPVAEKADEAPAPAPRNQSAAVAVIVTR